MNFIKEDKPALILIDIQKGFDDIDYWGGQRNNPDAVVKASELLALWRAAKFPVFHIQHCSTTLTSPLHPSHKGNAFKELVKPLDNERVIKKNVNSAFIGTNLKEILDVLKITKLVLVGLTTDQCVSTTARMAGNFGYDTYVVADATATFNKKGWQGQHYAAALIHETALASLHGEFATVVSSDFIKQRIRTNPFSPSFSEVESQAIDFLK